MMLQTQQQPTSLRGIEGGYDAQQRRLAEIDAMMTGVEALVQLLLGRTVLRVQCELSHAQRGVTTHHLCRSRQAFPVKGGAQNVVPLDHLLQGSEMTVEERAILEGE